MYLSSVIRYLTLSLASLAASVIPLSICLKRVKMRAFVICSTASTMRHCSPRSCSMIELSLPMRLRQCSSSVRGPCTSSPSPPPLPAGDSASLKSFSICSHQSVTSPSSLATTDELAAAAWIAAGLFSILSSASLVSISASFMPPARLWIALSITTTHFFCSVSSSSFSLGFIFFTYPNRLDAKHGSKTLLMSCVSVCSVAVLSPLMVPKLMSVSGTVTGLPSSVTRTT
mmetsp:Transcript_60585/g.145753  ORF Transcript_60585/g.145753 Transcript_60585/m.145753 type:complete len:229 (+) Transcript_60585:1888-2574(+)